MVVTRVNFLYRRRWKRELAEAASSSKGGFDTMRGSMTSGCQFCGCDEMPVVLATAMAGDKER